MNPRTQALHVCVCGKNSETMSKISREFQHWSLSLLPSPPILPLTFSLPKELSSPHCINLLYGDIPGTCCARVSTTAFERNSQNNSC
jgi:hypothetical protein